MKPISSRVKEPDLLVIGGGPAGLRAAEVAAAAGRSVVLADAMPSVGRKLLVAGRGGLNLTHSEPMAAFVGRYRGGEGRWGDLLDAFGPEQLRGWALGLGIETYVGSSGRVFPVGNRAAALLRAWVTRLRGAGVEFLVRYRFEGFGDGGAIRFSTPRGPDALRPRAAVFALGGASWPETGSDGAWVEPFRAAGIEVRSLVPSNCGFDVDWSPATLAAAEGAPLKNVAVRFGARSVRGELMVTRSGLEGGALYQLSAELREAAPTVIALDLKPDSDAGSLVRRLARFRGKGGLLRRARLAWNLDHAAGALLEARAGGDLPDSPEALAGLVKDLPIRLERPRPIAEAISSAGGVAWSELDDRLMLRARPGCFVAGEMIDWEAPTGGYLLTGCFATGDRAGRGAAAWCTR